MRQAVVIGGGISGLACAYELHRAGVPTVVVERDRLGGTIRTERVRDFVVEGGPDSFLAIKPWARQLCEEIGLKDRLIGMSARRVYILSDGKLHEMPEGFYLTVPTRIWPFLTSGLFSFLGKMRMGMDLILPRGPEVEDESIGSFIRRRLGQEALERVAEPIMAGIFVASADDLSLRCTFPRFAEMEREHRSLIKAMRKIPRTGGDTSPFLTLRGGMSELIDRLLQRMPGVTFLTGKEVLGLEPDGDRWRVRLADGALEADAVILAVPTHAAVKLRPGIPRVRYVSTSTVSIAYRKFRELEGSGFVIRRSEDRKIMACTWTSSKFADRAPADHLLVRCFVRGVVEDAAPQAHEEMRSLIGVREEPVLSRTHIWGEANPVYEVGHERRMREYEATLPPGLFLAGSGFHGTGVPDCVRDGRAVGKKVAERLKDAI
jgi:oxygen-dependent protoporphyrinogen oxidase